MVIPNVMYPADNRAPVLKIVSVGFILSFCLSLSAADEIVGTSLKWKLTRFARMDGTKLIVDVPPASAGEGGNASADVDLSALDGRHFWASVSCRGENVSKPHASWNGLKFQFEFRNPSTGVAIYQNTQSRLGTFPAQTIFSHVADAGGRLPKVRLVLGLQDSSGKVVFDLATLKIGSGCLLYPRTNETKRVAYPAAVRARPQLKGVMLPGGPCKEDDFRTLKDWGATLARYQMCRNWGATNSDRQLDEFRSWLRGKLDHLDRDVLPWAEKYGIWIVVDLHVPPGGRKGGDMNMFYEEEYSAAFIDCWREIARRFKGRRMIYGYDLINEPQQTNLALCDYWTTQSRAAHAIRAIDPDVTIVMEANGWDSADGFTSLSPLDQDNVIYQVHMYQPLNYTHQRVIGDYGRAVYPDEKKGWNRDYLVRCLKPVRDFQLKHGARIYAGEFSAAAWAPGAERYLADCISIFNEYGWDWSYHAFREWKGWSVEHEGPDAAHLKPSADNPRRRVLLDGLRSPPSDATLFTAMPEKTNFDSFDLTNPERTTMVLLGPDENDAVKAEVAALVEEVRQKTGVKLAYLSSSSALGGSVFVSTQPWAAKNAWFVKLKNSILAIHGSDFEGTCRAVRAFRAKYVTPATGKTLGGWTAIDLHDGPQRADVFAAELKRLTALRKNNRDWENELVTERNRLPARAYSFPLAKAEDAFTADLPSTPFVKSLNGRWKYKWCGSPKQRPTDFFRTDYDDGYWYSIDVPSCVEMKGYGRTGYVNIVYPHRNDPPFIGDDYNPVSSYRTTFTVPSDWKDRRVILRFDGVYSAYYVWVNGHKVGYAQDSCLPSEFDITPYLNPSPSNAQHATRNLLCVEVYRWSDGSYLEDQDMFRLSGIFRDVSLWAKPEREAIEDFFVRTDDRGRLDVACAPGVDWKLYDADYREVLKKAHSGVHRLAGAHLWSAESPYLYTLVLTTPTDIRTCKVGFRSVELKPDGRICINGKSIKFRGTNRHDWSYENGHTLSHADLFKDVMLLKRYNFDSVRTSHYPNDPYFYHLCDRYGIYLQAEANLEAHGRFYGLDCLAHVPSWYKSHIERCTRMVLNYRNSPSIYMWSLGNEAGSGPAFEACHREMLALDRSRLYMNRNDNENFRIQGHGYLNFEAMARMAKWTPFVMSEYAVSKGNALGNFEEYWEAFRRHDALPGGYVWDWYDQCVKVKTDRLDPKGKRISYWAYGGDFDEVPNDGNYATNGMIGPERESSPELIEAGHVQRPFRTRLVGGSEIEIENFLAFTDANAADGRWTLTEEGETVAEGAFRVPSVAPGGKGRVTLPKEAVATAGAGERFLRVSYHLRTATDWAPKGWEVAHDQMRLSFPARTVAQPSVGTVTVRDTPKALHIAAGVTTAEFSKETGTLSALEMNGKTILRDEQGICRGPRLTCRRGFTDDDIWLRPSFYASGITQLRYHPHPVSGSAGADGSYTVRCTVDVDGAKSGGFVHETVWTFRGDGTVELKNVTTPKGTLPQLPRFGLSLILDAALENVCYYGRGPWENYVDRCTGSDIGLYRSTVTAQYVDYVRPQDNGYKTAVRWAAFLDAAGDGVLLKGSEPMCLQALHFGVEELEFSRQRGKGGWKHSLDLEHIFAPLIPRDEVMVNFDLRQLGLGNAACGPRPLAKYTPATRRETWTVTFVPVKANGCRAAAAKVPQTIPPEPKDGDRQQSARMGFDGA